MKSIMHDKKSGTCYLCILLNSDYSKKTTQEHHVIYGKGNRKLSERYGLKVYLCIAHHLHDGGPYAVHRNKDISDMLCVEAQKAFGKAYPDESFRTVFGCNYWVGEVFKDPGLAEASPPAKALNVAEGFKFIEDGLSELDW